MYLCIDLYTTHDHVMVKVEINLLTFKTSLIMIKMFQLLETYRSAEHEIYRAYKC